MNPTHSPIFCLDTLYVVNGPEKTGSLSALPLFYIRVMTRTDNHLVFTNLSNFIEACKEHAPAEYRYVEQLKWFVENGGAADFRLLLAMEEEGYDIERMAIPYFENEDWRQHILPSLFDPEHPDNLLHTPKGQAMNENLEQFGNFLFGMSAEMESAILIAQAVKAEVFRTYPALVALPQQKVAEFINKMKYLAMSATDMACEFDDYLDTGEIPADCPQLLQTTMDYKRKMVLENRERNHKQPTDNPVVKTTILDYEFEWEISSLNSVVVWFKGNCDAGEFHHYAPFSYLQDEALLHFPDLYHTIVAYRKTVDGVGDKEKEIVEMLLTERVDLTPVLDSYVNACVDVRDCIAFDKEIKSRNHYENRYDMYVKGKAFRKPEDDSLKDAKRMARLSDRLHGVALKVLYDYFPSIPQKGKFWMRESIKYDIGLQLVPEVMNEVWGLRKEVGELVS